MDVVCRYGGDEFAIIVPETTGENAMRVAEKNTPPDRKLRVSRSAAAVTISCGVADFPAHGTTRDESSGRGRHALYLAKQAGRNRVKASSIKRESSATGTR